jgi:GAF domain-containing protein
MTTSTETVFELPDASQLAAAFVDLARSVNDGKDMVEVFSMLAERCVTVLSVAACGILVIDPMGELEVIGSSNHSAHLLDLFQVQNVEGPCLQSCRTGEAVIDTELSATGPWPGFSTAAREQGYLAVYAVPLAARGVVVGALNLFAHEPIRDDEIVVAQALADAATIALLQADPHEDAVVVTRRLHMVVEERNTIEQAKGVLSQRFSIDAEEAFVQLRRAGERTGTRLVDVAMSVVTRDNSYDAARLLANPIE